MQLGACALLVGIMTSMGAGDNRITNQVEGAELMTCKSNQTQYAKAYQAGQALLSDGKHAEAQAFQKAAWQAFQETSFELKPVP